MEKKFSVHIGTEKVTLPKTPAAYNPSAVREIKKVIAENRRLIESVEGSDKSNVSRRK